MAMKSSGIDPVVLNRLSAALSSQQMRSTGSMPDSVKLQALAAAVAGTKFQQTGQNGDALTVAQQKLQKSIDAIKASNAPASMKKDAEAQAKGSNHESTLTKILNVLGKPKTAVVAGVARLMDSERNFMKDLRHNVGTADVLAKADWFKNLPTAAKISIGIAGDIAADPLTYLTGSGALEAAGGASGLSEKLANAAVDFKRVGDTANEARAVEIGGNLLRKGKGGIGSLSNADLKWIGEVTGLGEDLKGGLYFQTPFTGRFGNYVAKKLTGEGIDKAAYQIYLGRGPVVQAISSGATNALNDLKTSSVFREIGDKFSGSTGQIKRSILEAASPAEALRRKAIFSGLRTGEGASMSVVAALDSEMARLYKMAEDKKVAQHLGGVLDGNHADIAAVDSVLGHVASSVDGTMVPFSQRLREFDDSVITVAESQIRSIAEHLGVDPEALQSLATIREGHFYGMLSDEAKQLLDDLGKLEKDGTATEGLQGFQNQAKYVAGQTFNDTVLASPHGDLTHATATMGGNKYVLQPKGGDFGPLDLQGQQAVDSAVGRLDGSYITNNEQAAAEYLASQPVQSELKTARDKIKAAKTPEERAAAQQALQDLQDQHLRESQSLMNVRVQRNGTQEWMIVPTDRIETNTIARSTIGPRTQVNQLSMESNGFPFFNMDWGVVGKEQVRQAGNAVRSEVLGTTLKKYGTLGGLQYAADLNVPESTLTAQKAIDVARSVAEHAQEVANLAGSNVFAERYKAFQFAIDKADEIRNARDRLVAVIRREGKLSSTPKRKQLAALEHDLELAMNQLDTERAAFQKATETLKGLNNQRREAQLALTNAKDAAEAARAQAAVAAVEQQMAGAVDQVAQGLPVTALSEAAPKAADGTVHDLRALQSDLNDAQHQFDSLRVEPNVPKSEVAAAKQQLDAAQKAYDEAKAASDVALHPDAAVGMVPDSLHAIPDAPPLVPDEMVKAQADFETAAQQAQQQVDAAAATPHPAQQPTRTTTPSAVAPTQPRYVDPTERELMYEVGRRRSDLEGSRLSAPRGDRANEPSVFTKGKTKKFQTKGERSAALIADDERLLAEAEQKLAAYRAANGLDSGSAALDASIEIDRLNSEMLALSRDKSAGSNIIKGTSRKASDARSSVNEERAFLRDQISGLKAKLAESESAAPQVTEVAPETGPLAPSPEVLASQKVLQAHELVNAEPDVMRTPSDYQRLLAEANSPSGDVARTFDAIKTENARGFTPEMKQAVTDVTPKVAAVPDARTALQNPEIVAEPNGVEAVVAASKALEESAAKLPMPPASAPSVLSVPEDEFVRQAQNTLDEVKADIARQKQYGTKNRASRVANREQQVADIEQAWIALDEKIRVLDQRFAEETARRAAEVKNDVTPLMGQILGIKESIRVARDAEVNALKFADGRLSNFRFTEWVQGPIAEQQFRNALFDGWTRIGKSTQVPQEVADIMALMTKVYGPDQLPSAFRMFDKLTTLFKKWAIASPGFITRNGFGGMFNNWLGGVDAGRYAEFLKADHQFFKAQRAGASVEQAFEAITNPQVRQGYKLLHASGVLAETDQAMDAAYGLNRVLGQRAGRSPSDLGVLSDNVVTRAVYKGNHRMERVLRGAAGLDAAIKSNSIDQIFETVFKLHFNYADLNRFEVNVMKRVSPFYAWTRFNLPLQMEMLVRNPKVYNHYNIFAKNIQNASAVEDIVPSWMKDRMAISLPWDTKGGRMYAIPDLPLNSLQLVGNLDEWGGQLNPVIKTPIEMALDRKLYFGKSAPFREGYVAMPAAFKLLAPAMEAAGFARRDANGNLVTRDKYLYALEQFMPFFGRARRLLPDEAKYQDRLPTTVVNFLFGTGLRTNTTADKLGELSYRQQTVDQIAKDLNTAGFGGYVTWQKQVALSRKPVKGQDKNPYLTLIAPRGGLGSDSPYTNVPAKLSTGQMLAALKARQG